MVDFASLSSHHLHNMKYRHDCRAVMAEATRIPFLNGAKDPGGRQSQAAGHGALGAADRQELLGLLQGGLAGSACSSLRMWPGQGGVPPFFQLFAPECGFQLHLFP